MADPRIVFIPIAHAERFLPHTDLVTSAGGLYEIVDLADVAARADVLSRATVGVAGIDTFHANDFEIATNLPAIITCTTGVDPIDLAAATARGVMIGNTPDLCIEEVADHTLMLLLSCYRRLPRTIYGSQQGPPRREQVINESEHWPRLRGQVVGLLGLGNIAQAVAERCKTFGLEVIAHDPYVEPALASKFDVKLVGLHQLFERSDYLSLHAPLNPSTHHIVNEESLAQMKPTAFLINAARGPLVDEAALASAIGTGQISGAALDVLEIEPASNNNPLLTMRDVLITPHTAGYSQRSRAWGPESAMRDAATVIKGGRPRSIQNPKVLDRREFAP